MKRNGNNMDIKIKTIIEEVCDLCDLSISDVAKRSRKAELVYARHLIFHFIRKYVSEMSLYKTGSIWKETHNVVYDHSTIVHANKKTLIDTEYDKERRKNYEYLDQMFSMLFCDVGDSYGIKKQLFNKLRNTYDLGEIYEVLDYYKELVGNMNKVNNELKQKIKSGCIRLTP